MLDKVKIREGYQELVWIIIFTRLIGVLMGVIVANTYFSKVMAPGIAGSLLLAFLTIYQLVGAVANIFLKKRASIIILIVTDILFGAFATFLTGFSFILPSIFVPLLETMIYLGTKPLYYTVAGIVIAQAVVIFPTLTKILKAFVEISPGVLTANIATQLLAGGSILIISYMLQKERATFQEDREKFKSQKEFLQEMITKLESERENILKTVIELKKQLDDQQLASKLELEKLQKEMDEYIKRLMNEKSELEEQLELKDKQIKELEAQIEELSNEIEALKEKLEENEAIIDIVLDLFSTLTLEETINNIINVLQKILPIETVVIFFREPFRNTYRYVVGAAYGPEAEYYLNLTLPEGENLISYVARENTPIVIESSALKTVDGRILSPLHSDENSAMALPLIFKNKVIGVLYLSSHEKETYKWAQLELLWKIIRFIAAILYLSKIFTNTVEQGVQDPQTGLYNHIFFYEQIKKEYLRARRYNGTFSIALIKIENYSYLKELIPENDFKELLKEIGERLLEAVRDSDIVARADEDTFGLLLISTSLKTGNLVLNRVISSILTTTFLGKYKVNCKGAIVAYPDDSEDFEELLNILITRLESGTTPSSSERSKGPSEPTRQPASKLLDLNF